MRGRRLWRFGGGPAARRSEDGVWEIFEVQMLGGWRGGIAEHGVGVECIMGIFCLSAVLGISP